MKRERRTMMFTFNHFNFNVLDLEKSLKFYKEALGLQEVRRKEAEDGSFIHSEIARMARALLHWS